MKLAAYSCLLAAFLAIVPGEARCQTGAVTRRALLIANSTYQHLPPLAAPKRNADALADALSKARFQRQVVYDLPQTALIATVRKFMDTVQPGDFVLIYFSGYGLQADELNYILPVGFDVKDQSAVGLKAFSMRNLQRRLEQRQAGTKMLLFDASRPGPGLPNGLAAIPPAGNTLVSFSAAPNQSAPDPPGAGVNVFTTALIRAIEEPGAKAADVLTRAQAEVSRASSGQQVPSVIAARVPDFVFNLSGAPALAGNGGPGGGAKGGSKVSDSGAAVIAANPNTGASGTVPGGSKGGSKVLDSGAAAIATNPNTGAAGTGPMWRMDGGDLRRSGYAPYRGPRKLRIAWSAPVGTTEPGSPLVGPDGRVYLRNGPERVLRCVEDGRVVWSTRLQLDDQVGFGSDGSVQLSSIPGRIQTLDHDGKPIREDRMDIQWLGLYVWRGHSYNSNGIAPAGSTSTRWYFFRPDNPDWRVEVDGKATLPVIDEGGVLYVGTAKGTIYGVSDAANILWRAPTDAGPTKGLAVTHARDILAAVGQSLFSVHEGQVKWRFPGDGDGTAFPPIHDQTGTIYFGKGSYFYAVSSSGQKLWQLRLGGPVTTAPAMDRSGRIFVATATQLYCITDVDAPDPPQPVRAD
jgi:hypothetical protein